MARPTIRSPLLALVLLASRFAHPLAKRILTRRLARGKEDAARITERLGQAGQPRPAGLLIWFHAASVGEAMSLLSLIEELRGQRPDVSVLVTTGTKTSAEIMGQRLPDGAIHQFVPVDTRIAVRRFLDHWKPDLAVWTESELWPQLVVMTAATGCPMILANARMSVRSNRRMRRSGHYASSLLGRFDAILAQDETQAERFQALGAPRGRVRVTGSLKDAAQPLPHDDLALKSVMKALDGRTVWLAASTHPGEEAFAATAHREARRSVHNLLMLLVPRHPDRGPEIAATLTRDGWTVGLRSRGDMPDRNTEIYVADTLAELGLWYRVAAVSFIGGSLVDVGGHNPIEPALLGSAILAGPHVQNFEQAYARFRLAGAAVTVQRPEHLGQRLIDTLPPDRSAALATAAWSISSEGADVTGRVLTVIERHLPPPLDAGKSPDAAA